MIEFPTVTKEIRSLVSRRQELITFLGTVFAAMGIFLQNTLAGSLPPPLASMEDHIFLAYAVMLMVPSLLLALRIARLHGGMMLNGVLYATLMQHQEFTRRGDPERAARHNYFGVSFLQFVLADVVAAFSAFVLAFTLTWNLVAAAAVSGGVLVVWLALYFRYHARAVKFALRKAKDEGCAPFTRQDWEAHISASLEDANRELIATIGFVGLMIFSVFEVISALGQIKTSHLPDLRADDVRLFGPLAYTILMLVTCVAGLTAYLRLRVAVGGFSLDLDPNDHPFQPLTLTDSLLGYLLLAFLTAVSFHLTVVQVVPGLSGTAALSADGFVVILAVAAEQWTLVAADRRYRARQRGSRAIDDRAPRPTPGSRRPSEPTEEAKPVRESGDSRSPKQ